MSKIILKSPEVKVISTDAIKEKAHIPIQIIQDKFEGLKVTRDVRRKDRHSHNKIKSKRDGNSSCIITKNKIHPIHVMLLGLLGIVVIITIAEIILSAIDKANKEDDVIDVDYSNDFEDELVDSVDSEC